MPKPPSSPSSHCFVFVPTAASACSLFVWLSPRQDGECPKPKTYIIMVWKQLHVAVGLSWVTPHFQGCHGRLAVVSSCLGLPQQERRVSRSPGLLGLHRRVDAKGFQPSKSHCTLILFPWDRGIAKLYVLATRSLTCTRMGRSLNPRLGARSPALQISALSHRCPWTSCWII